MYVLIYELHLDAPFTLKIVSINEYHKAFVVFRFVLFLYDMFGCHDLILESYYKGTDHIRCVMLQCVYVSYAGRGRTAGDDGHVQVHVVVDGEASDRSHGLSQVSQGWLRSLLQWLYVC